MLPIIDANIILRYLIADDEKQFEIAKNIIEEGCETNSVILAEVVYVLAGRYDVPRKEIASALSNLLETVYIENPDESTCALELYAEHNLDFADCLLLAANQVSGRKVASFDKKLRKHLGDGSYL